MADNRSHVAFKGRKVDPQRERRNANRIAKRLQVDQGTAVAFALQMIAENRILVCHQGADPEFNRRLDEAAEQANLPREEFIAKTLRRGIAEQEKKRKNSEQSAQDDNSGEKDSSQTRSGAQSMSA